MPKKNESKDSDNTMCCKEGNPFVAIPAVLGGIFLVICVLFLLFGREQMGILVPIVWAFVVLGIVAILAARKANK
jgi:hypothetical protein